MSLVRQALGLWGAAARKGIRARAAPLARAAPVRNVGRTAGPRRRSGEPWLRRLHREEISHITCAHRSCSRRIAKYRRTRGEVVDDAMMQTLNVAKAERFQILPEHARENLTIDPNYLGINRSADCVVIKVTLGADGRADASVL